MPKHGFKIALCSGLAGMALFAGTAQALSTQECGSLDGNQFLAAVERGTCRIDIQTAAGPNATFAENGGGDEDGGDGDHNRRGGEGGGHHDDGGKGGDGGDGGSGGGNPNGGPAGAKP